MTRSDRPWPKLRLTRRSRTPGRLHEAQRSSGEVEGDDKEVSKRAELDECVGGAVVECESADDAFDFASLAVALTLDDFTREEDVFEIKD